MTASSPASWRAHFSSALLPLALLVALEVAGMHFAGVERSWRAQGTEMLLALLAAAGLAAMLRLFRNRSPAGHLLPAGLLLFLVTAFVLRQSLLRFDSTWLTLAAPAAFVFGSILVAWLFRNALIRLPAAASALWIPSLIVAAAALAAGLWLQDQSLWLWSDPTAQLLMLIGGSAGLAVVGRGIFGLLPPALTRRIHPALAYGLTGCLLVWIGFPAGRELFHRPPSVRAEASPEPRPPIILLTLDALRADAFDQARAEVPGLLDDFVADSVRFTKAMSPSCWTLPSLASLLTGTYPSALGAGQLLEKGRTADWTDPPAAAVTLPEVLSGLGYQTAALVDNPWLGREFGSRFQHLESRFFFSSPYFLVHLGERLARPFQSRPASLEPELMTARAVRWLDQTARPPFFLWVHYLDPHLPYLKTPFTSPAARPRPMAEFNFRRVGPALVRSGYYNFSKADQPALRRFYQGEAGLALAEVERLLRELKRLEIYDAALIILSADHGEEFWEHGNFEHGHSFHQEVLHVPLLIKFPRGRARGRTVAEPVDLTMLPPTILAVLGQARPPAMQGANLIPCVEGRGCPEWWMSEAPLYYDEIGAYGTRDGQKIIIHGDGSAACYDLVNDPGETSPFACSPELRQAFSAQRQANLEHRRKYWPEADAAAGAALDPETRARLRALGYLE